MLSPGRQVWSLDLYEGITTVSDFMVTGFKQFLPAGPVAVGEPGARESHRKHSLVQLFCDPGGLRTLAVADLRLKKPHGVNTIHGGDDE